MKWLGRFIPRALLGCHVPGLLRALEAGDYTDPNNQLGTLNGTLASRPNAVFRQRSYWARKNTAAETSRDRFSGRNQGTAIRELEDALSALGCGPAYCATIRQKVCRGRTDAHALRLYEAALARTLKSKKRAAVTADYPF